MLEPVVLLLIVAAWIDGLVLIFISELKSLIEPESSLLSAEEIPLSNISQWSLYVVEEVVLGIAKEHGWRARGCPFRARVSAECCGSDERLDSWPLPLSSSIQYSTTG